LVAFHRSSGAEGTISLTPVEEPSAFGVVPTDDEGRVTAFIEKPPRDEAPTDLISAGTYVLEPSVLDRIRADQRVSIERETFPALVEAGTLFALRSDAYWLDTGTPDAYLRAHRDLLLGHRPGPPAPGAELDPSLGTGVWRMGSADVRSDQVSHSLIGNGALVAAEAVVEESVIGAGAVVEEGASIIRSVLMPGARVASKAAVEGSVIGPEAIVGQRCVIHGLSVVGAGAVTASGTVIDGQRIEPGV
jgi:NDP-sugar pyrophosphorylase family protein